jgi:hypothetical protein
MFFYENQQLVLISKSYVTFNLNFKMAFFLAQVSDYAMKQSLLQGNLSLQ